MINRYSIFTLFTLAALQIEAQVADSLAYSVDLNELVVQSFKQDKSLKTLPASASQITGTVIRNQQIANIKEFSATVPNFYMPEYGSKYTSPVFIRGIGAKSDAPSVGLYVDGVPYFEKSAFVFEFNEVERIEVLRGPQGTLYGRNTMGGLIQVYTRSPLKYQGTNLNIGGGSYDSYQVSGSHYGCLKEKFGYAVAASYRHDGGYFENTYTGKKADHLKSGDVRVRLEWEVRPDLKLGLTSMFDHSNQGANAYAPYDEKTSEIGEISFNSPSFYRRTLSTTGFNVDYEGDKFQVNYQHSLQYSKDDLQQDQDFTVQNRVNSFIKQKQWMTSGELNVKTSLGRHYKGLLGTFGFYQHADKDVNTVYAKFDTSKFDEIPTYGLAIYHQSVIDNLGIDRLSLTLGLRYDFEKATRDYVYYKDGKLVKPLDGNMSFSQLLPKVALQYTFPCSGQLYASVSKGYKTGGFNTSFNKEEEKSYGPEDSWNYEIGAKHPFLDKKLQAEMALFWIDWRNQQIQEKVDAGGFMIKNAGKSVSRGVEFSLQCNPMNGLMMTLNYGFTDAYFKRYHYSDEVDYAGNHIPLVPQHTLGGNVNYSRSLLGKWIDRYQVGMSFSANGKIYWKEDNQQYQSFYGILNANASVTKGIFTIGCWAKNLTDTNYISYMFTTSSGKFVQKGRPFTIGGKLSIAI